MNYFPKHIRKNCAGAEKSHAKLQNNALLSSFVIEGNDIEHSYQLYNA